MGLIKVPKHTFCPLIFTTTKKGCLPVPNIVFSDPLYVMPHCFVSGLILNRFIGVGGSGSGSSFFAGKNKHILMILATYLYFEIYKNVMVLGLGSYILIG